MHRQSLKYTEPMTRWLCPCMKRVVWICLSLPNCWDGVKPIRWLNWAKVFTLIQNAARRAGTSGSRLMRCSQVLCAPNWRSHARPHIMISGMHAMSAPLKVCSPLICVPLKLQPVWEHRGCPSRTFRTSYKRSWGLKQPFVIPRKWHAGVSTVRHSCHAQKQHLSGARNDAMPLNFWRTRCPSPFPRSGITGAMRMAMTGANSIRRKPRQPRKNWRLSRARSKNGSGGIPSARTVS
ncbi:hypothetical protein NBRC3188_3115 [Acetobacter pasteurianus NBRC 3188]|uniref:Uncharacterized protein n=1 Tax=Acetobacter pasteurianus NBRC 3188 TaxID=1226663 RepID=A0A401WYH6_ACEPA|nr:hypothetical protein NBRC3188_3115 [Acetobacter pasteurianus NBRC 3188]